MVALHGRERLLTKLWKDWGKERETWYHHKSEWRSGVSVIPKYSGAMRTLKPNGETGRGGLEVTRAYHMTRNSDQKTPHCPCPQKIHKNLQNPPGRQIVASTDSFLAPIDIFLEKILTPLIRNISSFPLDTGAFLETVQNINPVSTDTFLVSFEVKDLYTSIPHIDGINSTRWLLSTSNMNHDLIDFCCDLLSIVLTNNFFLFEDTYYLQIKGSAMGSNVAPLMPTPTWPTMKTPSSMPTISSVATWWCGNGDLTSLHKFFQFLKTSWPGLYFTMRYDYNQISFLDTLVIKDDSGNLSTDLYSKPTDRNSLLHYDSFHPRNMKKSIPKSQIHRVAKIVSNPVLKEQSIQEMKSKFLPLEVRATPWIIGFHSYTNITLQHTKSIGRFANIGTIYKRPTLPLKSSKIPFYPASGEQAI
ncbi:unnamed protein product [Ranitomeya imitator]|uniref:Helix-turn-helix domain-containing protein n=1 Tax=Ranitomeya imitator TaxID=111125 RepID=A0ABN9M413_9NEOB|nr:unnamed protein product [Ranitomeya imitator]